MEKKKKTKVISLFMILYSEYTIFFSFLDINFNFTPFNNLKK